MNRKEITKRLQARDETVLSEIAVRFGPYIRKIAFSILRNEEDAKEVENDVYLKLWRERRGKEDAGADEDADRTESTADDTVDNMRTDDLSHTLGMYARQLAIDKLRAVSAKRRGSREYELALDELAEVLEDPGSGDPADRLALQEALNRFLKSVPLRDRQLFLSRYWYALSIRECAKAFGMGESAVKTALHRLRGRLKASLEQEGLLP